ncbi:hypothetical protein [Marinoscillum furvescens]|uniref:hypothetical protein n=1 Tax=Marinoscillum furvescens TaxID=1026 RepID=UPI0011C034BB|nr:hypothetical protein [Marinoscillum furvescens]
MKKTFCSLDDCVQHLIAEHISRELFFTVNRTLCARVICEVLQVHDVDVEWSSNDEYHLHANGKLREASREIAARF